MERRLLIWAQRFLAIGLAVMLIISLTQVLQNSALNTVVYSQNQPSAQVSSLNTETLNETGSLSWLAAYQAPGANSYSSKPMALNYSSSSADLPTLGNESLKMLESLGYSSASLWQSGINVIPHYGSIEKNCGGDSGLLSVSGLAIKPLASYTSCSQDLEVIPSSYRTQGKCSVHFNAERINQPLRAQGNSRAVFVHELGHCLYFVYGESSGMQDDYKSIRPETGSLSTHARVELMADDFMICRHGADTAWGSSSYYNRYSINPPSQQMCQQLNSLFDHYFPM